jgi:hypothetical protein
MGKPAGEPPIGIDAPFRLAKRELGALLDLCWGIDGEAGALHHRYERQKKYGNDISCYERPETEAEIRAFALAVVDQLDRRGPDAPRGRDSSSKSRVTRRG